MKNSIKRIIAVFVLVVGIFFLSGCGKDPIVGKWDYSGYVYTFNADKTGNYELLGANMPFTYETKDNKISILYDGSEEPLVLDYKLEGNTLIIVDSFGSEVKYEKK